MRIPGLTTGLAVLILGVVAGAAPSAVAATGHAPSHARSTLTFEIPGEEVFPEGVAADPFSGAFFVGSTTDGTVYRGTRGSSELEEFLPAGGDGRTTAIGMKLRDDKLYVAGGPTGRIWVYDTRDASLVRIFDTGLRENTFLNDLAFDSSGNAYVTDSLTPVLWRVPAGEVRDGDPAPAERFLDLDETEIQYTTGFNLNGIAAERGGRTLLTVQSNTGKLFRVDPARRTGTEIAVTGGSLTTGDGLVGLGGLLLVVRHDAEAQVESVDTVRIRGEAGRVVASYTDDTFMTPTTAALSKGRLLVVNSQFDARSAGAPPELPFTVSGVPVEALFG